MHIHIRNYRFTYTCTYTYTCTHPLPLTFHIPEAISDACLLFRNTSTTGPLPTTCHHAGAKDFVFSLGYPPLRNLLRPKRPFRPMAYYSGYEHSLLVFWRGKALYSGAWQSAEQADLPRRMLWSLCRRARTGLICNV